MKKFFWKSIRGHHATSAEALASSAAVPVSPSFAFIDNSQGASAATAELSKALDTVLNQIEPDASISQNGCQNYEFTRDYIVMPSAGGTVKAMTTTIVAPRDGIDLDNKFLPALVVAVRGSESLMDHMVNANTKPKSVADFIKFANENIGHIFSKSHTPAVADCKAHSGFLNSAEALNAICSQRIDEYIQKAGSERCHIVFTGHSAGGAVASLLYLRHISNQIPGKQELSNSSIRLSCITFGALPVVDSSVLAFHPQREQSGGVCMNFVNEFDMVSRADRPYIICLVNLLRSLHGRPPLGSDEDEANFHAVPSPETLNPETKASDSANLLAENVWPVTPCYYHHVGPRIVLLKRLEQAFQSEGYLLELRAMIVPPEEFQKLLFCRLAVHRRVCYAERVQMIEEGKFNGCSSWAL
ncbi:uncharacterized protein GIQ15_04278 [Arthroderma uncinatum]|uniref:uncharacterized protein n=1 Tax=Arthroderma uncinatum TaxID=74035 RepID=UPI00144A846A|nr:uncharacterized protein GIQ15_04278 [Arthroderma uncinatum]KAF3481519.1 hypothetical protein GIQ15_04278 [Arthroderma uncinatum]